MVLKSCHRTDLGKLSSKPIRRKSAGKLALFSLHQKGNIDTTWCSILEVIFKILFLYSFEHFQSQARESGAWALNDGQESV